MLERFPSFRILYVFFSYVARSVADQFDTLRGDLRSARMPTTYHGYLARTMLYAVAAFVVVVAVVAGLGVVYVREVALRSIASYLVVLAVVFPGVVASYLVYRLRLYYPSYIAGERARSIELSMANVVNFLLALSRAGVPTEKTLRLLSENADVLGEAANELRFAWRDIEYFGADVTGAIRSLSDTTPDESLSTFLQGYLRALTGRGEVDAYLEGEMQDLFDEARIEQEEFLSTLGVLAESYVAVFVAFPIFGLIILMVIGFIGANVLTGIRAVVYVVIPLSAISYLILLDIYMSNPLAGAGEHRELETTDLYEQSLHRIPRFDRDAPGDEGRQQSLDRYVRRRELIRIVSAPITLLRREPIYALYLGSTLAVLYFGLRAGLGLVAPGVPLAVDIPAGGSALAVVRAIDDVIVEALLIGLVVYGVFYELRARYLSKIERALPDFLNELGDRHEIGMSLASSIQALTRIDLGDLDEEIRRMSRDVQLGSEATDTLKRFANRVRSPVVTRVVVLLTAAADTADRLEPVIDALADRAELTRELQRERRVEMSLYVIIIYISYLVFLVILVILNDVFLPEIPEGGLRSAGFGTEGFNAVAYQTIFYHVSIVQAVFSGLVGGKMSEGTVSAGVKHAFVMVLVGYLVFTLLLPNVTIAL